MDTLGLLGQALECSVCLEQLDATSRVLPCQHTFCKACLLDIINTRKELRCPECRSLVTVPFDSLKCNILLLRILEEIKNIPQSSTTTDSSKEVNRSSECLSQELRRVTSPSLLLSDIPTSMADKPEDHILDSLSQLDPLYNASAYRGISSASQLSFDTLSSTQQPSSNIAGSPIAETAANAVTQDFLLQSSAQAHHVLSISVPVASLVVNPTALVTTSSPAFVSSSNAQTLASMSYSRNVANHSLSPLQTAQTCESHCQFSSLSHSSLPSLSHSSMLPIPHSSLPSLSQLSVPLSAYTTSISSTPSGPASVPVNTRSNLSEQISDNIVSLAELSSPANSLSSITSQQEGLHTSTVPISNQEPVISTPVTDTQDPFRDLSSAASTHFSSTSSYPGDESSINLHALIPVATLNIQAKALYNYDKTEERDLNFRKGDIIRICKQVDGNWFYGELNGNLGFIPATYIKLVENLPAHVPQCRALYDFKISSNEEKNCLVFSKGDTITVLRRIDDNWAEGKLNTRIGIFPLSFVSLNNAVKKLLNIPSTSGGADSTCRVPSPSITTSPDMTSPHGSLARREHLPPSGPPRNLPPSASGPPRTISPTVSSHSSSLSATTRTPSSSVSLPQTSRTISSVRDSPRSRGRESELSKRHSVGDFSSQTQSPTSSPRSNRYSVTDAVENSRNLRKMSGSEEQISSAIQYQGDSTAKFLSSIATMQLYVALYSYRPRKADELELKIRSLYSVDEKCQDGWFKGRCLTTSKTGVFPGNYVQPAKAQTISTFLSWYSANVLHQPFSPSLSSNSPSSSLNRSSSGKGPVGSISNRRPATTVTNISSSTDSKDLGHPPELPPRQGTPSTKLFCASSAQVLDNQRDSGRGEMSPPCISSPCPSPIPFSADKKGSKDRGVASGVGGGVSLLKKLTTTKKQVRSSSAASLNNRVSEEPFDINESTKASFLRGDDQGAEPEDSPKHSKQPVPLIRERYRCIEAYPPNGNNELELQIGDLIYVHKKRDDGWYHGTLPRTGKTGLFPASFVESC